MDGEREFVEHFLYVFKAPVITWPGYEELAKGHRDRITTYRLAGVKDIQEKKATDYEAMLYVSTASLAVPLDHDWVKLYTRLFREFYGSEKSDYIGITEEKVYENELHQLYRLKSWIYKRQMEHLKPLLRDAKKSSKEGKNDQDSKVSTLFDFIGDKLM